jgi:hypothetical protein
MVGTQLVFRTPLGAQVIPGGTTTDLTSLYPCGIPVNEYPVIRIYCDSRTSSDGPITLFFTNNQERELVGNLDSVTLQPGESFTMAYEVPCMGLTIQASMPAGVSSGAIDVLVYGYVPYAKAEGHCYKY